MTANNTNGVSAPHASTSAVDSVDAFALKLYRRARNAGPDFEDIAFVVRNLHTVLRHLKIEAEDPESLLNVDKSAVYDRQLTPMIEDCEFTLKQLNTIFDKHGGHSGGNDGQSSPSKHRTRMDGDMGWTMENVEREKIGLIRSKLMNQKLNIDMFLDTIQLHNSSKSRKVVDTSGVDLEAIKDKVDAIATRICKRRNSNLNEDEEELWLRFRNELEREGFSRGVLRKNQDVLRAYIRQLDERTVANGGATPSVLGVPTESTNLSYEARSSDDDDAYASQDSMALMSTRDLMALDKRNADLAIAMDNMHLQPAVPSYPDGVRYEARPDFVAVLGTLTRDEIIEFARRSAEVRNKRKAAATVIQKMNTTNLLRLTKHIVNLPLTSIALGTVPPPKEDPKESTASPAATSKPKPILKNKDEDPHVRFDPEPHILDEGKSPPRGSSRRHGGGGGGGGGGERDKNRDRDRERDRDRDRDGGKKYHSDRYLERDRYVDRDRRERDRYERERERDRERDRDRKYHHSTSSSTPRRDGRSTRKRGSTSDALKAVGIGGAAASLLSVLTEAASGL
ncbi:hypothetical protein UCREL1_6216 [Eutypa lata UCREL1]|uniref:DUF8035 domain-containing protein n=1 Tax=Eutypa lata (strain UCR-EL1) TaxID=1287681 RepID=M7SQQ6_EUTLA|nr:hypothetical protein UCREL1_6216 [Eutypa lata UCREL1]